MFTIVIAAAVVASLRAWGASETANIGFTGSDSIALNGFMIYHGVIHIQLFKSRPPPSGFELGTGWHRFDEPYSGIHFGWLDAEIDARHIYLQLPLWLVICVLSSIMTVRWRWRTRPPAGRCPHCLYDLFGNSTGICPECGKRVLNTAD